MVVVALAVFLAGLVFCRVPVTGTVVRAELGARRAHVESPQASPVEAAASDWLGEPSAARQAVASAIRSADARRLGQEPNPLEPVSQPRLEQTIGALQVSSDGLPGGREIVRIHFMGNDAAWALALVEHLTRDYLGATPRPTGRSANAMRQVRLARWQVEVARHYERKAWCRLEGSSPPSSQGGGASASGSTAQVDYRAEGVESREQRAARQKEYGDAVQLREAAERALTEAIAGQATGGPGVAAEERWLITPPTVTGRVGGRPSAVRVGSIGLAALLAAAVVGLGIGCLRGLQRVGTIAELEMTVPLPVIGQLSLDPISSRGRRLRLVQHLVRVATTGAELTLAALIVSFLVAMAGDGVESAWLRADPLAAAAEAIGRAWQRWF